MIENKDCLEYLKTLPSESVDLVLIDPPYFIGFDGGKGWDKEWKLIENYLDWCQGWTKECVRVLKPDRMFIVWGTLKTETILKYRNQVPKIMIPQNEIIWSYNWGGRSKDNFARKHEYAFCWSKGNSFLFNAEDVRVERKVKKNLRTGQDHTSGTIPTCVWEFNNHTMSKDFCNWHPTTKNLDVLERIIRAYTNPSDTVLDIFMGSGSTAIAAVRSGRKYLGCEKDSEYYTKSLERINNERRSS